MYVRVKGRGVIERGPKLLFKGDIEPQIRLFSTSEYALAIQGLTGWKRQNLWYPNESLEPVTKSKAATIFNIISCPLSHRIILIRQKLGKLKNLLQESLQVRRPFADTCPYNCCQCRQLTLSFRPCSKLNAVMASHKKSILNSYKLNFEQRLMKIVLVIMRQERRLKKKWMERRNHWTTWLTVTCRVCW